MASKVMIFIDISFFQCIQFIINNSNGPEYVFSHRVSVFHDHLTSGVDNSIIIQQISKAEKKYVGELF